MTRKQQQLEAFNCSIGVTDAALSFPRLQTLMGISKASHGKKFQDWTETDKKLWRDIFQEKILSRLFVRLRYMPSEECFFVRTQDSSPYLAELEHKSRLYQKTLVEKANGNLDERVEARVYARNIEGLGWSFTVALYWDSGKFGREDEDLKILCDIPMIAAYESGEQMRENMKRLGFEAKFYEPLDGSDDEFGDFEYFPNSLTYKKNGVEFDLL